MCTSPAYHVVEVDIFLQRQKLSTNPAGFLQGKQQCSDPNEQTKYTFLRHHKSNVDRMLRTAAGFSRPVTSIRASSSSVSLFLPWTFTESFFKSRRQFSTSWRVKSFTFLICSHNRYR